MPVKNRRNKRVKTVSRTIRMTKQLDDRITDLALKSLTTKSNWIIHCLEQKAYRHKDNRLENGSTQPSSDSKEERNASS